MTFYGYTGQVLNCDLSSETTSITTLDERVLRRYIGGSGLAARLLAPRLDRSLDPFDPNAPLAIVTGPLTGTRAPNCGRYTICARSPQTGLWGESNIGGFFGPELKFAGYDAILIEGRAEAPVYLNIENETVTVRDAAPYWAMGTYETIDAVQRDTGEKKLRVSTIGPAGENRVKFACIRNSGGRTAGRTGLGAVWGAKRLKAIAVCGDGDPAIADEERFDAAAKDARSVLNENFNEQMFRSLGTAGYVDFAQTLGDMPNHYFSSGYFDGAADISGSAMAETILVGRRACYRCPIACGREIELSHGAHDIGRTEGPEYETVGVFGSQLGCDDLEAISYLNYRCNDLGLDTISTGGVIGLLYYLYNDDRLDADEIGHELRWGDVDGADALIGDIAAIDGVGELLAEGIRAVAERFDAEDIAAHVHGLDIPMHDPRAFFGLALGYITGPRGACHLMPDVYMMDMGLEVPAFDVRSSDRHELDEKAPNVARFQDYRTVYNAMVMCHFANVGAERLLELFNAATGFAFDPSTLQTVGRRIFTLKRIINLDLGLDPREETLPPHLMQPLEGGTEERVPDLDRLRSEYYRYRQWDIESGWPNEAVIEELELDEWARSRAKD